jgi:hypothetical protein
MLALALALPLIVWGSRRDRDAARVGEVRVPDGWTMADLLRKLEPLGLREVPCNRLFPIREPHRQGTGVELP